MLPRGGFVHPMPDKVETAVAIVLALDGMGSGRSYVSVWVQLVAVAE